MTHGAAPARPRPRPGLPLRVRAAAGRHWRPDLLAWLPIALAAAYGLVVLGHFRGITASFYMNSDYAMGPVIAHALGNTPPGTTVTLGDYRWYEPLTFLRATDWLPFHRQVWDVTPLICDLGAMALLVATARRAFGFWPAMLSAAALACVGQAGLQAFLTFNSHGATAVHTIVVCAALVWLASCERLVSWRVVLSGSIVLGLFSAAAIPDPLFLVWAITPLAATAGLIAWRSRSPASVRVVVFALVVAGVAVIAGHAYESAMRAAGITTAPFPLSFAPADALGSHITTMLEGFTLLAGGDFFGLPVDFPGLATFVAGGLVLAALGIVLVELRRGSVAPAAARPNGSVALTARFAYVSFWAVCLLGTMVSATFVTTSGANAPRYLLGGYVALAALLPVVAQRGPGFKFALAVGVSLLAATAVYQIQRASVNPQTRSPSTGEAAALARFVESHGLRYGYAGYWDSLPFSWASDYRVEVFPVAQCAPTALTLCRFSTVHVSSWYRPRADTPTFLIVDPTEPFVGAPDPALGRPVETAVIGHLEISVYGYDIASRFGDRYAP